jgi:hypothetical protein
MAPTKRRLAITGTKRGFANGFHARRGAYLLRYADGCGLTRGAVPLGPTPDKTGLGYVGAEQTAGTTAGFAIDGAFGVLLAPLAGAFSWHAAKQAAEGVNACHALKTREAALKVRLDAAAARLQQATPEHAALFQAEHAVLRKKTDENKAALKLRRNNVAEAISSAIDRGAVFGNMLASIGAKIAAVATGKGVSSLIATAGSAGVSTFGLVASFALAPIAGIFQLTESIFQLRRASLMKNAFDGAAPQARDYLKAHDQDSHIADYAAFFDRKFSIREKFYRRFKRFAKFRVAAASLLGASATVKVGVTIAALAVGGFALSSPVGWALTGVFLGAAILGTVGAAIFFFDRRRSSYDRYTYQDDALIDRDFIQNLDALDTPSSPTSTTTRGDTSHTETAHHTTRSTRASRVAPAMPRSLEHTPLLANNFIDSSSNSAGDDDDDEDSAPAPAPVAVATPSKGLHYRSGVFQTLHHQRKAWQNLRTRIDHHYNLPKRSAPLKAASGFYARISALTHALRQLAGGHGIAMARNTFERVLMKKSTAMTHGHYRQVISQGNPAWRSFMISHLRAEKSLLENKQQLRQGFSHAPADHPLMRYHSEDNARLQKIGRFLEQVEPLAANQIFDVENISRPEENRVFLSLIEQNRRPISRTDEEVSDALARAMRKHYKRRNRDLMGILFETELDATRVRAA